METKHWGKSAINSKIYCIDNNYIMSDIPPVIAPSMRGARMYNTELKKNSTFLKENGSTKGLFEC
jgi:hypothetical protein